jgi:hypothetical protein
MKTKLNKTKHKIRIGRQGFSKRNALLFTFLFAGLGTYIIVKSFAATPATANFWIDGNGGSCTRQSTPASYTDSTACPDFNTAYHAAQPGDLVLVKSNGSVYPTQKLYYDASKTNNSTDVTFQAAANETVTLDYFESGNFQKDENQPGASHVTMKDFYMNGPDEELQWHGGGDITLINMHLHGSYFDGVNFHDTRNPTGCGSDCHTECLDMAIGTNYIVRNSKFTNCEDEGFKTGKNIDSEVLSGFIFENNVFSDCAGYGVQFFDGDNVKVRNNSFDNTCRNAWGRPDYSSFSPHVNFVMTNNLLPDNDECRNDVTYKNNYRWDDSSGCDASDKFGPANVNATTLAPNAGSPLINAGNATSPYFSFTDINGNARDANPDIGAYEYGASGGGVQDTTPPTVSLTTPSSGATVSGNVTISANASDNIEVSSVQFKVDGSDVGIADTTSPYSTVWDASIINNGAHTLTAVARDPAGNITTSGPVSVTVTGGTSILIGSLSSAGTSDQITQQQIEAWPFNASASGNATQISVWVQSVAASNVLLGLYEDNSGTPGALKGTASLSSPTGGQFNTANLTAASGKDLNITIGTVYWVSVLGTDGTVTVRDLNGGGCNARVNSGTNNLTSLPNPFSASATLFPQCPLAAYVSSTSTTPPPPSSAPVNTTAPTTSGTIRVSSVLTSSQGSWNNSPTSYSYQWQRCDSSGANCVNISGGTSSTFTLTCTDYKKTLKVAVKAINSSGNATATSNATAAISKPSTPKKGDFNDDCFIDAADISQFISGWRKPIATYPTLDITGPTNTPDSFIDAWDLQLLVTSYGYKG